MATSTTDAAMILRNCVKIEQLVDPLPPVEAILRRCNKAQVCEVVVTAFLHVSWLCHVRTFPITVILLDVQIMEHYGVPDFHTALEFLALLARRQGKLRKGGLPDTDKAAKSVLIDWTGWVKMRILEVWQMITNQCSQHCVNVSMLRYLGEGSATSRTLQRHTPSPHTSALRLLQRWVKLLTGMSWKKEIRRFLQVKKKKRVIWNWANLHTAVMYVSLDRLKPSCDPAKDKQV